MSVSVCLCVCVNLSVRDHIFGTTRPIFTNFVGCYLYGRGSVLLWRRSDGLRISGYVDDKFTQTDRQTDTLITILGCPIWDGVTNIQQKTRQVQRCQ